MDESIAVRPAVPADLDAIVDLMGWVFHEHLNDEGRELEAMTHEVERSFVADDGGAVVGHTTALSRDLTVPGAVLPAAHVTGVGVLPTHRRRGLLTALMHRQLAEIAAAGNEAVAVLWASESAIYPRFGYGPAAARFNLDVPNREIKLTTAPAPPAGRLRLVEPIAAIAELAAVFDRLRPAQVGWSSRDDRRWRYLMTDNDARRDGASGLHGVILDAADGPAGYALWRAREHWNERGPIGEVQILELAAGDPATYTTLWRFLLGIDLTRSVTYRMGALDEALFYQVDEPRRISAARSDSLWVRLIDLPAALEARRYAAPVDVVLEITDPLLDGNSGRWRLTGDREKATCVRTGEPADLACSITDLGAVYLGGTSLTSLAAAGRVQQLTGNLPSVAFGWERLPNPTEVF
ncbi:MAG: GNAT family N-acetyltransferase [Actinoplanes sp.]